MSATRSGRTFLLALALFTLPLLVGGPSALRCTPIPVEPVDCPAYVGAAAECPFRLVPGDPAAGTCDRAVCDDRCAADADCAAPAPYCVTGNCVTCWRDDQCAAGSFCRAGRCKDAVADPPGCPDPGSCDPQRCRLVSVSEEPCPVCVCDSAFNRACAVDFECQVLSSHPYAHCVWGRCAECRSDDECPRGTTCLPPGMCFGMEPDPAGLYGLWLVGWYGGLDHFSYLRFEPDGTLRRGAYEPAGAWSDDILDVSCTESWPPPPAPQLGTWEPEQTQSGFLVIRIRPNGDCWQDANDPAERFLVTLANDGHSAQLRSIDLDGELMAVRMPAERCTPDLASCETPRWEDVYELP